MCRFLLTLLLMAVLVVMLPAMAKPSLSPAAGFSCLASRLTLWDRSKILIWQARLHTLNGQVDGVTLIERIDGRMSRKTYAPLDISTCALRFE